MTTPTPFKLHLERVEPGLALVSASGQISEPMFASPDPLADLLGPDCRKLRVLLNLEQTTFIDSSGINWLVRSFVAFRDGGGWLVLHSVAPAVLDTLRFMNLDSTLAVAADLPAARALALEGGRP
jgi:anti-anti-sigma factor